MNNDEHSTEDDDERSMSPSANNSQTEKMRKVSHSEIERRRREKMNRYIDEIAQLLPIDAVKKLDKLTVLRAAVDTIKHLKGSSNDISSTCFGKQNYLTDKDLFELILATIDQLGNYFFLIVECEKGRICYASTSVESTLGYKPIEICSEKFFDLVHPDDLEVVRQEFFSERIAVSTTNDDLLRLNPKKTSLEIGRRRTFSSRIRKKVKRSFETSSSQFCAIDFVGYMKEYSLTADSTTESKFVVSERQRSTFSNLTTIDVFNSIGTDPVMCLLTMGRLAKRIDENQYPERMFLWKLNSDGKFTYFDQISYSLLGYVSNDLLGKNFIEFIHEDDRNKLNEIWIRVCRDRQIVTSGFYRFRSKDDVYITFQTIFEPFVHPWNDELEIIVARNKIETRPTQTPESIDIQTSTSNNSNDLVQHFLPDGSK